MTRRESVLICFDGSPDAERAIDAAVGLLRSRKAVVLDVAPTATLADMVAPASSVVPGSAFEARGRADAPRRARAGAEYARRAGFDARPRASTAPTAWRGIVAVADELDAAVIVIGSRGLSRLSELALGSVSHNVASHARRPVLIVPPSTEI
jgi:nucleotide-binding universal stress UspA family protein